MHHCTSFFTIRNAGKGNIRFVTRRCYRYPAFVASHTCTFSYSALLSTGAARALHVTALL